MLQLLFFVLLSLIPYVISTSFDIRLDLKHVDADSGLTRVELLRRAALRGKSRAASLIHNSTINAPVQSNGAEYLVELAIGSPAQPVMLILDTGSDLIWTQCQPCLECFNQSLSLYAPSNSSTFSRLSCSSKICRALPLSACHGLCMYMYGYGDKSTTIGVLGAETFTFGTTTKKVKSAFASQLKLSVINDSIGTFDVCFSVPISSYLRVEVPKLIYHFEGADMDVPRDNYVVDLDEGGGLMCLLVSKSKSNDVSIIGNIQQQNMWIEYDLEKNELGFAPAQCDQL
uniref:Peptidase A1 domain-containing protein n=1 Tax=Ananas comosus var. bracteatus TaxID=296719 RepID=A0A6V7P8B9_ANACO|nr:unnamed protein product [Ananas comosus var. bracteatus]